MRSTTAKYKSVRVLGQHATTNEAIVGIAKKKYKNKVTG